MQDGIKVDPYRGGKIMDVSSQWFFRPDDQRFLDLYELKAHVQKRADNSRTRVVDPRKIEVKANPSDTDFMAFEHHDIGSIKPNHWSFGQISALVGAPASYLRKLPATIAGINMQYGLASLRTKAVKLYYGGDNQELYAMTGAEYGRVHDYLLVDQITRIAASGRGETRWKIPGVIDWSTKKYNPFVDISKQNTTLYASDRDVFIFLVDDTHPIEIGKLWDGSPDIVFRGFYCWNSEVGSKTLGISTFLFRAVCANRCIWGVQDVNRISIRHNKYAAERFASEVGPALISYSNSSEKGVLESIRSARNKVVAADEEEQVEFLTKRQFTEAQAKKIIDTVIQEEGHPPSSIWDFVNGITAVARGIPHTDDRVDMERRAGKLLAAAGR